jgi:hypothetical protein
MKESGVALVGLWLIRPNLKAATRRLQLATHRLPLSHGDIDPAARLFVSLRHAHWPAVGGSETVRPRTLSAASRATWVFREVICVTEAQVPRPRSTKIYHSF